MVVIEIQRQVQIHNIDTLNNLPSLAVVCSNQCVLIDKMNEVTSVVEALPDIGDHTGEFDQDSHQ